MTAVLTAPRFIAPAALSRVVRRLTWRHGLAVLLATLAVTTFDVTYMLDKLDRPEISTIVPFNAFASFLLFGIVLMAWLLSLEFDGSPQRRTARLVALIVLSATVTTTIAMPVAQAVGLQDAWLAVMKPERPAPPVWLPFLSTVVQLSVFGLLFVAAAETLRRRSATQFAVQSAQREQATMAREVLESRLTAMQAQVEPQFLFDTLVDIEALYRQDAGRAALDLDRLITYLRVALPRLREPGSTVEAEIELVEAYLAVVTSLHGGRPALTVTLPDDCRRARFYPMLLLPLLHRAVRHPTGALPETIRIGVSRVHDQIVVVARFSVPDHCDDDPEIVRVRERLVALFGAAASLDCTLVGGATLLTMRVPADVVT